MYEDTLFMYDYYLYVLILLVVFIVLYKRSKIKRLREKLEELERQRNLIVATPVMTELQKIEVIVKMNN